MGKSLVAFDTDHIKSYVFATNKLKEIRGASSILDNLNRETMVKQGVKHGAHKIYALGGSGLFLVDDGKVDAFMHKVKREYLESTGGRASVTAVQQAIANSDKASFEELMRRKIPDELKLIRYKLRLAKGSPLPLFAVPTHPFMRPCDACGIDYAEQVTDFPEEPDETSERYYCTSCVGKHREDVRVKKHIRGVLKARSGRQTAPDRESSSLWDRILSLLSTEYFSTSAEPERPSDFNVFRQFSSSSKEYLGLVYADANNMGTAIEDLHTLAQIEQFSIDVDESINNALATAIESHLPVVTTANNDPQDGSETPASVSSKDKVALFPFDILLLGGDDVLLATSADKAMDVALTIAQEFRRISEGKRGAGKGYTLSVGVVLAPVKYPFGLLLEHAEAILKLAKKSGAKNKQDATHIDFRVLTGGRQADLEHAYESQHSREDGQAQQPKFYATMRPYTPANLTHLLQTVRKGQRLSLGRTKLHQLREAILQMNLTTSVSDGQALLRNWRSRQRDFVAKQVFEFGGLANVPPMPTIDIRDPFAGFPRVTFPWFRDNQSEKETYRTPLLDFVELYDFVAKEGNAPDDESESD